MIDAVLGVVAPHICKGCEASGSTLCDSCFFDIIDDMYAVCIACESIVGVGNLCRKCTELSQLDRAFVVGERRDALKRLIGDFKFNSERASAKVIASLLDARLPYFSQQTTIIPIPTIAPHVRQRGFDHTKLIAKHLSKLRKWPIETNVLLRKTDSVQHKSSANKRIEQAEKAFEINPRKSIPKQILLLDDIYTTGATVSAAAKLLRNSGATHIDLGIIARQISK